MNPSQKETFQANSSTRPLAEAELASFLGAARECVAYLKAYLGDENFAALRVIDRKIPSPGEIILSETHGLRQRTIVNNLRKLAERLDTDIDSVITQTSSKEVETVWAFIRRIDDIADLGALIGSQASEYVHNLAEYHLSLINCLQLHLTAEGIDKLIKRFSARQALRAPKLVPYWAVNHTSATK